MAREKLFLNDIKNKYGADPSERHTEFYKFGGIKQSKRKTEAWEAAQRITKERGIPNYNPDLHLKGVQLGQKILQTYKISGLEREEAGGTISGLEMDDLNYENNAAMQQCHDDIRRTCINGLNIAHETVERRFGKEVTPESISFYLELVNHNIGAGCILMEHVTETNPELVKDSYAKVFTGNDELADSLDKRFVIDLNKMFPPEQAEQIKAQIGDRLYQVSRIPTMVQRTSDGGLPRAWMGQQASLAFLGAYDIPSGDAVTSDFVFTIKHGDVVFLGTQLPYRRAARNNALGGIALGYMVDVVQSSRTPEATKGLNGDYDPCKVVLETLTVACVLYDQGWLHNYMAGGSSGWSNYIIVVYCDNVLDDFAYYGAEWTMNHFNCGIGEVPPTLENAMTIAEEVGRYVMEQYDIYPALCESHYGGSQRFSMQCAAQGAVTGAMTGDPQLGISMWYYATLLLKEHALRLGFYGHDLQDQQGICHTYSYRSDQGAPFELRGHNYPDYAMNVGHTGGYCGIIGGAAHGRRAAYSTNPIIKAAFADDNLVFDFRYPRREFGRGGLREFMPAGERDAVIPPH
jgi:methyl-coenzyme M reductase alpha subunit